jgi:hypothetical protein
MGFLVVCFWWVLSLPLRFFVGFFAVTQQGAASTQRFDFPSKVGFFGFFSEFF